MTDQNPIDVVEVRLREPFLLALDGDTTAYRDVLTALAGHLRAFFRRRLARWPDEVEDLVQDTLLAIHHQRHTYDRAQPLTAWVHAIARYKYIDLLRRRGRADARHDSLDQIEEDGHAALFTTADSAAAEARRDLGQLLAHLPDRQRLPILHTQVEGLSVAETAQRTGLSESAVKVGVHRGLKALAALVSREQAREGRS